MNPNTIFLKVQYEERKQHKPYTCTWFYVGPLTRSNWNLKMLAVVEGGKPENREKNPNLLPDFIPGRTRYESVNYGISNY